MTSRPAALFVAVWLAIGGPGDSSAEQGAPRIRVDTPMSPPAWALLERELLRANAAACGEFFEKYFDERGFLLCVPRWGGDDGPDDAIESCLHWPILHALGGDDRVLQLYKRAWEGHLRQYTLARTTDVPLARDGMYYREFPVQFDWLHHAEGLTVFNHQGLSDAEDPQWRKRTRRYAGFYLNDDPQAQNYDPQRRIVRSMFNGSRGPLLRRATALDWAGDPIEVKNRFALGHGERSYQEMLDHFRDYNDIVGDHPQNLLATALPLNAFMLTGESRWRDWVLEYVDAWRERMLANDDLIPTKIGLDGKIGGDSGQWYGGVYGWAFSVVVPQSGKLAHRNTHYLGLPGFMNAYLLTGDDRFLDPWRRQIQRVNSESKVVDGRRLYPHMCGADGWYDFTAKPYQYGVREIAYLTMQPQDLRQLERFAAGGPWWDFVLGKSSDASFPERALRADLERVRRQVAGIRADETTPDTRLADDPMKHNPVSVASLVQLALGGLPTNKQGLVLHCNLRYFDPERRRAGLPADCAALVERLTADSATVTLVNISQLAAREVTIQAGGYAEHEFTSIGSGREKSRVASRVMTVRLEPGCGARLELGLRRHAHPPTIHFPWRR